MKKQTSTPKFVRDYIERLKNLYINGTRFMQPDWPPIEVREPTNLVIISKYGQSEEGFSENKIETMNEDYVHGKIDNITAYKKEVELADILSPVPSEDGKSTSEPKVLMDGAPGVGKTTLAIKACSDWAKHRLFGRYELLVLVSLREVKYRKTESLEDLFPSCSDKKVIEYYEKSGGKHVVMIFDGYDELSHQQRKVNSIFLDIIRGEVLPECAVLVTSRPYASGYLHELKSINRHVEVLGFKREQIYACVKKCLPDSASAKELTQQLEEREDILSLCYIPLNCMIMIHVYKQKNTLTTTMTELMSQFIIDTVIRGVKYKESSPEIENVYIKDLGSLPHPADEQLHALEQLAYKNLIEDQFIFSQNELLSVFRDLQSYSESCKVTKLCLGLLTSMQTMSDTNTDTHFQFLHLSIQEYLAARYAVKMLSSEGERINILRKFVDEPRFQLFLLFYVGMMPMDKETAQIFFHVGLQCSDVKDVYVSGIYHHTANPVVEKFLYFAHMIFESQQFETFGHLFDALNDKKVLSLKYRKLTLFDCTVLSHFFCSIDHSWEELDLQYCSLGKHSLQIFERVYKNREFDRKTTQFFSINFNGNDPNMLNCLEIFPWLSKVKKLSFDDQTSEVSKPLNLHTITHIPQLCINVGFSSSNDAYMDPAYYYSNCTCITNAEEVELCQTDLGEAFGTYLHGIKELKLTKVDCSVLRMLHPFIQSLSVLSLHGIEDIDGWLDDSAKDLARSSSLQKLVLCDVGLTSLLSAKKLFQALSSNTSITELHFSVNSELLCQEEVLEEEIKVFLSMNNTVTSLCLCNCINDQNVKYLIAGLKCNSSLIKLDISNNLLSINAIEELISVAVNLGRLDKISIERNVFRKQDEEWTLESTKFNEVTEKLFCALSNLSSLSHCYHQVVNLSLFCSDLDTFVCVKLFQVLQQNKSVEQLIFTDKFSLIANDKSVSHALKKMFAMNTTLKKVQYHSSKNEHDCVYEHIAAGVSVSVSLKHLLVELCSVSGISKLMRGLRNCRLNVLEITPHYRCSSLLLAQDDSKSIGFEFEQFLANNSTLVDLTFTFILDDEVLSGIAEGLLRNNSLKCLHIALGPLVASDKVEKLFCSANCTLTSIDIDTIGSLMKIDAHWNLMLHENGINMWSKLKYALQAGKPKYKITMPQRAMNFPGSYQVYKVFSVLALSKNLSIMDFSNLHILDNENFDSKKIGLVLNKMLTTSSSLDSLILKSSKLPDGVWEHAAEGLSSNNSLRVLDLCCCGLSSSEAACIFTSLKSNRKLETFDISKNLKIKQGDHPKLNSAIEAMFQSNSSLCDVNLQDSISDKAAIKAVTGLNKNQSSRLRKLVLDDQSFSVSTLQHVLQMVKGHFGLILQFSEVTLTFSAKPNIWLNFIDMTYHRDPFCTSVNLKKCKLVKLFCSMCNICLQHQLVVNVVELELIIDDDETVIAIFRLLTQETLSQLRKISLNGTFRYTGSGDAVSHGLRNMLASNETLHELDLGRIDETVATGLISGLLENNTLISLSFSPVTLSDHFVDKLLATLNSPNSGLLRVKVNGLPSIHRSTRWSMWSMGFDEQASFGFETVIVSRILFPQFIYKICVCPDSRVAKSILASLPELELSINKLDISLLVGLFKTLANNCTFKALTLSAEGKAMKCENAKQLSEAIQDMLVRNTVLTKLDLLGTLDNEIICGIIGGLKRNKTLRSLHIDNYKSTSNLEFIAAIMKIFSGEESSVTSLFIEDLLTLQKYESSEWKIEVSNETTWNTSLNMLKKVAPEAELIAALHSLDHGGCIGNSPRFDISCRQLKFQLAKEEKLMFTAGGVTKQSKKDIDVRVLLENVSTLEVLVIEGILLSEDACCNIINLGRHLKKLELTHNSISGDSARRLIHELTTQSDSERTILRLYELNISNNNLAQLSGDLGSALKSLLKSYKLKILKCASCHINDDVCGCIASGIQCNSELTCLDLSCNNITPVGIMELMASMQQNVCLEELNLSGNALFAIDNTSSQTRFGQAVSKMLECNHTLVNLNFDCDNLDIVTLKEISEGLIQNKNLALKILSLNISNCNVSDLSSLIPSLTTKLTCFNLSNTCSFSSSNSGWTLEVKSTNHWLQQICATLNWIKINVNKVIIAKAPEPELNFLGCSLSCSQLQSLLRSLEENSIVKELSLSISNTLTHTEHEHLKSSLESTLKKNCVLTHLEIVGAVGDEVIQGLEAGIKVNNSLRELTVDSVIDVQHGTVVKFVQSLEICNILRVELRPIVRLFRPFTSSIWQVEAYNPSVAFLKLMSLLNQGSVKYSLLNQLSLLNFDDISVDDALTCSLVQGLKDNNVTYLRIPAFWTIGKESLERNISHNNNLRHLEFDAVNDSVIVSIAKGLKDNNLKTLQILKMNISPVSESALSQLLQSLSIHPLKLIPQGHYIAFVRFSSDLQSKEVGVRTVVPLTAVSPNLEKVLRCLSSIHSQCQDLTIVSLQQVSKAIRNSLKDLLRNCKSLKVLRLQCTVNNELMQYLAAGLKENSTLCSLELNAKSSTRFCQSLDFDYDYSKEGFVFSRISGRSSWKLQYLHYFDERSFQNLCLILNHIEIDFLNCHFGLDTLTLKICSENTKPILIILKSIEYGYFPAKDLHLDVVKSDESKTIGSAIERMLAVNKSLETLTITMHLRDSVFRDHIVSGLCRASSLKCVVIKDKLQSIEGNSLVQKIIRANFTDSSIAEIHLDDINVSLHLDSIQTGPDWRIEMDRREGVSKAKAIPIWKVNSDDKYTIMSAFFLFNQALSNCIHIHSDSSRNMIGNSVLDNLRSLDISHTHLNFVPLFEVLKSDSKVTGLNLSHCTQAVSVETLCRNETFKSMLINNNSLELLNLTGLMDETFISCLIEVLPRCSLKSLSLDLSIRAYAFDKVEALVSSYANSKLIQLTFTDICHLWKEVDAQCNPQCISLECHLALPLSARLLKSYSTLFMLISINKCFCRLNLTLGNMDSLTIKVYRMFFTSVSQGSLMDSPSAPMNLLQSLKALQIDITNNTFDLVVSIMESLQCCHTSCLEELRLSHDKSIFMFTSKCQTLASCYEQLLSSNGTLQTVNFGLIDDVIAQGVAAGLKSSQSKLLTLQFNASLLTTNSMAALFQVFLNGNLILLQITDGIFIKKLEEGSSYRVDVFGDNVFLCKVFIALTQASPHHCSKLMTSFASGHKLDLAVPLDVHSPQPPSIKSMLANDAIKHMVEGGSYVTELILSGNTKLTKDDEDLVGSAFEHLLMSDQCTLCSLKLDGCQIPDAVCVKISEGLAENNSLKTLDLSRNLITSYGVGKLLVSLATNDTLMEIDLSDNELSDSQTVSDETGDEIKDMIKENYTLTKLHLISEHNCLCPLIAEKIATGLCDNTALRVLSLQIKEEGVLVKLFESLQHNQVLNELSIEESLITNTLVGSSIQNMLKCNRSLEILKMGYSGITDEVCKLIADGLSNNKQLKTLNLRDNRICSSGMISLFQVLDTKLNKCCLKELDVSLNCASQWRVSDHDGVQLDRILATNSSLEVLIISDGGYFGEWFGLELFQGLKCNSKLRTLDISRNYFDPTASKAFTRMIECNKTLTKLDISFCQFTLWNLNFTKCSLKKVIISADSELRDLFDDETSKIEIDIIPLH